VSTVVRGRVVGLIRATARARAYASTFARALALAIGLFAAGNALAAADIGTIQPVKGLIITRTVINGGFASLGAGGVKAYNGDMEEWDSVADATPEAVSYELRVSAPGDASADADMKKSAFRRSVRREDIAQATRISYGITTADPEMFAGQTFEETSVKALQALKSGAEVPFVVGALDGEDPSGMGALLQMTGQALAAGKSNSTLSGMGSLMQANVAHTYYRGSFRRVEPTPVMIPVLLNGVRVSLPTIHAKGVLTSPSGRTLQMQYWWLDSTWPLALKNSNTFGPKVTTEQVTRIDLPPPQAQGGGGGGGGGAASAGMADQLRKSCRVELSGIYFNTGSARLLDASRPALQVIARVVKDSAQSALVIAGHTDNVGTAEYNQTLSEKRAAAVRDALVAQFGVAPNRVTTKGYGLTKPLESNDTVEGRARNRRVELVCAGTH
jgi:outer membrane protein OmpA-like peptidoglycan-associated protein